jgi:hypothetical protein
MAPAAAVRAAFLTLVIASLGLTAAGCTGGSGQSAVVESASPSTSASARDGAAVTASTANDEQLDLIRALESAVPSTWAEPTVKRFRTCTTPDGAAGVQITREVRGDGTADPTGAAIAFRDVLDARGFDAEVRRRTEVIGTGASNRYAAFNADESAAIIQVSSACYAFDSTQGTPTVPPTPAS